MKGEQLELNLWEELRRAQQMPETVEVMQILDTMEDTAAQLPEAARLRFAGEALLQIAELCAARATVLMTEWEEAYRDPVVQQGFFTDLVRQTMAVDLSDLMEPDPPRKPRTKRSKSGETEEMSIVALVDKETVLALAEQWEAEAVEVGRNQDVWAIAHNEDVSQWIQIIIQELPDQTNTKVSFTELCDRLGLSWVEVWLGLLLGGFELEQSGEFYGSSIWVKRTRDCVAAMEEEA